MKTNLTFHNKSISIELTSEAEQISASLAGRLIVEIQVYFSCMMGKRLAYYSDANMPGVFKLEQTEFDRILREAQPVSGNLYVRFNTVMTASCALSSLEGPPPVTDFDIPNKTPYVPDWLSIDYKHGHWQGEFGWKKSQRNIHNTRQITAAD
jgi:hypothetical protein